ncbi:MAG: hypothetical protein IPM79_07140 [Polyangiaceae bacterium]|nr:hypothetical protein [Polyangiaceae bacterium]
MSSRPPPRVGDRALRASEAPATCTIMALAAAEPTPALRNLRVQQAYFSAEAAEVFSVGAGAFERPGRRRTAGVCPPVRGAARVRGDAARIP